jgi:hypothetical protein
MTKSGTPGNKEPRLDDHDLQGDHRSEAPEQLRAHRAADPAPCGAVET